MTGAVASERATEASKGSLSADRNRAQSIKAEGSLTARLTGRAGTKVGLSDPVEREWNCHRSTDKSYPGDNRLISPIKVVRELGSERRETVRSISIAGARYMREAAPSTRGPEWTDQRCTSCPAKGMAG